MIVVRRAPLAPGHMLHRYEGFASSIQEPALLGPVSNSLLPTFRYAQPAVNSDDEYSKIEDRSHVTVRAGSTLQVGVAVLGPTTDSDK